MHCIITAMLSLKYSPTTTPWTNQSLCERCVESFYIVQCSFSTFGSSCSCVNSFLRVNVHCIGAYSDLYTLNIGFYFTQDYAYRDIDGDYQIQGRKDDIIRVKGVWLQVPEIESNIVSDLSYIFLW